MATESFDEISVFKESLRVAYEEMVRAAEDLSPYLQHTCKYNKTNSSKGDVCTCKNGSGDSKSQSCSRGNWRTH